MKKYVGKIIITLFIVLFIAGCFIQAPITEAIGSLWSLLPPIIAIGLALITKEVYSSLFIGILTGGIVYAVATNGGFEGMFTTVIQDGLIANLADSYNVGILVFLVVLGVIVVLMNKAGGSRAYGEWAAAHIKSRKGAALSTFLLGVLIFVDDYFNCLTVGSVMRPVTDKHNVSRAKLAYLIDATAAPICIIAPISSGRRLSAEPSKASTESAVHQHHSLQPICAADYSDGNFPRSHRIRLWSHEDSRTERT